MILVVIKIYLINCILDVNLNLSHYQPEWKNLNNLIKLEFIINNLTNMYILI